jgi:ATP-binding cassette subfamily B protein
MWGMNAIEEEDRLDADAAKQVMRRAARMAAPFKRTVLSAIGFSAITTLGLLMGPVIVRYGIDDGIKPADSGTLRTAVIAYFIVVSIAYVSSRQQYIFINRAGEGFLRLLRIRVFGHIQKQSLAFFDRNKSGVLVARMTADIESMAELVQ